MTPTTNPDSHNAARLLRPSEEDERRALSWLVDRKTWEQHSPLERHFAATILDTLAWFEQQLEFERGD